MEVKGKDKVGSSEVYVIEATPAEGSPEKLYFDVHTGLLLRHDVKDENSQGKIASENYMDDYKYVDGVRVAHTIKRVTPMFTTIMKFTGIKTNVPVDDTKFDKPSN